MEVLKSKKQHSIRVGGIEGQCSNMQSGKKLLLLKQYFLILLQSLYTHIVVSLNICDYLAGEITVLTSA